MQSATVVFALLAFGQHADAEIRVGLAAPLSGPMASVGLAMQSALETAIAEINTAGGLAGQPLILTVADDACSGAAAERAAASLIAERPALVIGHPCSGAATKAATLYRQSGVLLIAVDARHPDVTKGSAGDALVLRLAGRDDRQGQAAARWLIRHAPAGRMVIVHDRTAYARAIAAGAKATLDAANAGTIVELTIVAGNRDYRETVAAIRTAEAEAVFFAGFPDEAAIIATGLAESGPPLPLLGTDSLATPEFSEISRRLAAPVQILLPSNASPAAGGPRDSAAASARAALEAWLATARRIGTTDAKVTGAAIRGTSIDTRTLGSVRFDENGDWLGEAFVPASPAATGWVRER